MKIEKEKDIIYMIDLAKKIDPIFIILRFILAIINGLIPLFTILATSSFINNIISFLQNNENINYYCIIYLLLVVAWSILQYSFFNLLNNRIQISARKYFTVEFTDKISKIKYQYIEDSNITDLIKRTTSNPEIIFLENILNISLMITYSISIFSVLYVISSISLLSSLLILIFSLPSCLFAVKAGKKTYQLSIETSKTKRYYDYLSEILKGRDSSYERIVFSYSEMLNSKFFEKFNDVYKLEAQILKRKYFRIKTLGVIISFIAILSIFLMISETLRGVISVGLFISIVNGLISLSYDLSWNIPGIFDNIAMTREYYKDVNKLYSLRENLEEPLQSNNISEENKFYSLEFRNVFFKYPNTDIYILKGVSFLIEKGKTYAFVGKNGCGKTTITKIILGLFDEYEGEILLNGISIKDISMGELCNYFCMVFQDYARYFITLEESLLIANDQLSEEQIENIVSICGLGDILKKLPKGIKTSLGKINADSVDLSGGEWQRVAIARSIASKSPIKILDEPTSALDPIAESQIYDEFRKISMNNTSILISHRLGSTQFAETIYVLDDGKIAEYGSHEKLMKMNGIYSNMFNSQRGWYL